MSTLFPFYNNNNSNARIESMTSNNNNNNNNIAMADHNSIVSCITPSIEEKTTSSSTSSITPIRKASDQSTIPSPPLSPYQKNIDLINTKSSIPISLLQSNLFGTAAAITNSDNDDDSSSNSIPQNIERRFSKDEFPLEELENRSLSINAWDDLKTGSYKKNHLNFLSNYQFYKNKNSGNRINSKRYNTIPRTRRIIHHINTSDIDSDFDKVRTRRVARETNIVSSSELPMTPTVTVKKPRKPRPESSASPMVTVDYESIPDFSPDLSTLPNNNKCLKQEWKGQPMSLVNDPLASKLHPAELTLASILRLPCSVYLDSKRRLFLEKVNRLKRGLPFRRTDAQKACKIDVNKASRLFAAFEKVGWLNEEHFEKYA